MLLNFTPLTFQLDCGAAVAREFSFDKERKGNSFGIIFLIHSYLIVKIICRRYLKIIKQKVNKKKHILPVDNYKQIFHEPELKQLEQSKATFIMFNRSELKLLGRVKVETINPKDEEHFFTKYVIVPRSHRIPSGCTVYPAI